jgi:DNA-binding MarR family transcriptional regulator
MAAGVGHRVEEVAQELFEVATQVCFGTLRGRRRPGDLKELEFLTLCLLQSQQPMIVGHIQRQLGVLPAQMSRIIRSLEGRPEPFISCHINPQDKRKINVSLTGAGEKALWDYQEARVGRLVERLRHLPDDEHEDIVRLVHKLGTLLERNSAE